jgi:hypothetical protein
MLYFHKTFRFLGRNKCHLNSVHSDKNSCGFFDSIPGQGGVEKVISWGFPPKKK